MKKIVALTALALSALAGTAQAQWSDDCALASTVGNGDYAYDLTGSTATAGLTGACGASNTAQDLYLIYMPIGSGTLTAETCALTTADSVLQAFTGCPTGGTSIACSDDACGAQSRITFAVTAGVPVYIRIADFGGGVHAGTVRLTGPTLGPAVGAVTLAPTSGVIGTNVVISAPVTVNSNPIASVIADCTNIDGGASVTMLDDGVSPDLAIDGTYTGQATVGAAAAFGAQSITVTATDTGSLTGSNSASFTVIPPPPANDTCETAEAALEGSTAFNNSQGTSDGMVVCVGSNKDIWYSFDPSVAGAYDFTTCGSAFDTVLSIYDSCGGAQLGCNDDSACGLQSQINNVIVTPGFPVYIRVAAYGVAGAGGSGVLNIGQSPSQPPSATGSSTGCALDTSGGNVQLLVDVNPGTNPVSVSYTVEVDGSALGLASNIQLFDDGLNGDGAAGDTVFGASVSIAGGYGAGTYAFGYNVTDDQSRSTTGSLNVVVGTAIPGGSGFETIAGAEVPAGSGPLTTITSQFVTNEAHIFMIDICDPTSFSATTVGGTTADTQLFLFDSNGNGIAVNDDSTGLQSTLTSAFTASLPAGNYYLAVSQYNRDPVGNECGGLIWNNTPFASERAPDGPAAASSLFAWVGATTAPATPDYTVSLTGACYPVVGCIVTCDYNQDGGGDTSDVIDLADAIASGTDPYPGSCIDFNQDGGGDTSDVIDLADAVASGTCP